MDIAIVGLGCRFPQARDPIGYWELIRKGVVTFRQIPASRWDHARFYDPSLRSPDKAYIDKGAYLDDDEVVEFGALHFGIAPRRVQVTDPQHRILLDAVRGALQDAGYEKRAYDRGRTGVFIGASANEHKEILLARLRAQQLFDGAFGRSAPGPSNDALRDALIEHVVPVRAFSIAGNLLNMAAAIVAQTFDLGGPALSIDAACSSALVATQQAIVNLRAGQIDVALAGGVYLNLLPDNLVGFSRIGAISRQGQCKPFDAGADGFVMGEGVGVAVLKRMDDALRDGDRIYAVVKGAAANNDGRGEGPMTPRQGGQLEALRAAYVDAGFSPATLGYIEAHGTATTVGDVVEVGALRRLFDEAGWKPSDGRAALGSVKANIGHTMSAAGIAGLMKAALALHHKTLPPQPSVAEENPKLELAGGPFFLPRTELPWETLHGLPRRAAVSSFGFGGTNAHLALEEAPQRARSAARAAGGAASAAGAEVSAGRGADSAGLVAAHARKPRAELFVLSGSRASVVAKGARQVAAAASGSLTDIAFTLSHRASEHARLAIVADSREQLIERLLKAADALEQRNDGPVPDPAAPAPLFPGAVFAQGPHAETKLAVLFPGQGAQRVGLLAEAYEQLPAFRDALDALLPADLRALLYAEPSPQAEQRLTATEVCQPVMAALGLALWQLLQTLGVKADFALGHSLGEFAAAAAAGVITPGECVQLVRQRGLAMVALKLPDQGAMASVPLEPGRIALRPGAVIANLNHPRQTVVSGETAAVKHTVEGLGATMLEVSHAFHSPLMAGVAQAMRPLVDALPLQAAQLPVVSAITGQPYPADAAAVRDIWVKHATSPVDFVSALQQAAADGARLWLQVGAGGVLTSFVKATLPEEQRQANVALCSRDEDGLAQLSLSLGTLWAAGLKLDFDALYEGRDAQLVTLPPSVIETQPYWPVERPAQPAAPFVAQSETTSMANEPLVALFREQVELLRQQARVLEHQAAALSGRGIEVPALPSLPAAPVAVPPRPVEAPLKPPAAAPKPAARDPHARAQAAVMASVARISAFPVEAIQQSQTLASDLGFDSLMTVELDGDISKAFPGVGTLPRALLGPQTTVKDIIEHVAHALDGPPVPMAPSLSAALDALASAGPELQRFQPVAVEVPLLGQPPREDPLPHKLLLTRDQHGVADALASKLRSAGHEVVFEGAAQGTIHLAALGRSEKELLPGWEPLLEAHRLQRAGGLFVVATSQGGRMGLDGSQSADAAVSAALAGYVKALARERAHELIKCVDLRLEDGAEALAAALFDELRSGNAAPEVGFQQGVRTEPDLAAAQAAEPISLGAGDVVLVTGGSRGVGLKLAEALQQQGCAVIVTGRGAAPRLSGRAEYVQWDVTKPAPAALAEARQKLGPITAIVHAAGISEDGPAAQADDASVLRVLSVKHDGLQGALLATAQDPLRLVVLVSSWAGRFGNAGQASYSAANAALSREATLLSARGVKALALEYPPWNGTGMVSKIPALARAALEERGVPFIDDAQGVSALLGALEAGATGPVLLAPSRPARRLAQRLEVRIARSEHLYLEDHQLAGQPVLPLASALDALAYAAVQARDAFDQPLLVRDFKLLQPVRIAEAAQLALSVSGEDKPRAELAASLTVLPSRAPAYTGFVVPGADPRPALASAVPAPQGPAPLLPLSLEEFYSSYTFHGPRMQAIESIEQLSAQGIVGTVRTSSVREAIRGEAREWVIDPIALDGAFQLAGYWAWTHLQRAGFPIGIEEYVQLAPLGEGPLRASLTLQQSAGDELRGTIVLQAPDGRVVAVARGVAGEFKHRDPRFLIGRGQASRPAPPAERPAPLAVAAPAPSPAPAGVAEESYKIELFPEVQELEQRLGLAAAFGLKNPYFNVHERVTNDTAVIGGRTLINWSSYNYLGLSGDPHVNRAAQEAVEKFGTSVSASRIASGEKPVHRELEQELAAFVGTEDSIVTVSGHGVFVTVIPTLMKDGDLILHDALAHDCILAGARLSGAKRRPFPHGDWKALEKQLQQLRPHYRRVLIAVEGVYSMDGDFPDLPRFIELKKKYGCLLLVDEAHSIGVMGSTGAGIGEHFGVNRSDVELWMGTLSKSFASCGGYVCGSHALVQFLKYSAGGFVFSVGISPANAAAALEALRQLRAHPEKVARLHERARLFLQLARERGIDTGYSQGSAVVPAILGNSLHALQVSDALKQRGINVQPILYPAVEETAARLRFFCTATHTEQQIRETVSVLAEEIARVRAENPDTATA